MSAQTSRDRLRIALYRLELSILPHVSCDAETRRRLARMEDLASGLLVSDRATLHAELQQVLARIEYGRLARRV